MTDKPDATTLHRQMHCVHAFIKVRNETRCVHCGVSESDWEQMKTSTPVPNPWAGLYGSSKT